MPTDNVVLSPGSGGSSMRTLADASSNEWPTAVLCYATTVSAGANVLQVVTPSFGLPVAQQGTWTVQPGNTANTTAWKVDASATTQPISAASLPLPSGASTAAKQPALGVAGTASADVLTVQGIVSMTPLKVDASATTQPVSAASLPLPSGASMAVKQPAFGTAGTASADVLTVQGITSMTALKVDGSGVTQPVSGTFFQATQPISGTITADQGGSWSVTVGSALPAGTNVIGHVIVDSGVITSVTSITNALPSGTNVIGHVIVDSGTIMAVTAITNALPSGTNVIGHVVVDSGSVTANAGTNLNTSALALEAGHLATIDAKVPALGQALAAASVPVVLTAAQISTLTPLTTVAVTQSGSWTDTVTQATASSLNATVVGTGTFAVQAAQSGTWNIGTVTSITAIAGALPAGSNVIGHVIIDASSAVIGHVIVDSGTITTVSTVTAVTTVSTVTAVTAITNALPAGTNLLGQISASDETGTIYSGTTALTPKFAVITASSSGATTIVAAVTSKKIRVLRWSLSSNGTVNVKWQSHVTPTDLTGLFYLIANASAGGAYCPVGVFQTISGEALDINLSASIAVGGVLTYCEVP